MYVCLRVHMHIRISVYICTNVYVYIYTRACVYTHTHTCVYMCVRVYSLFIPQIGSPVNVKQPISDRCGIWKLLKSP